MTRPGREYQMSGVVKMLWHGLLAAVNKVRADRSQKREPEAPAAVNAVRWALLRGRVARELGRRAGDNPYPRGAGLALAWEYGRSRRTALVTVSHETSDPRGAEYGRGELELIALARAPGDDRLRDREIAEILGRSHGALRAKITRMRKAGAL